MMERARLFAVCILALGTFTAPAAHASTITQSSLWAGSTFHFKPFGATFQQFDPALGTLQSVTLSLSGDVTYDVSFTQEDWCTDNCSADFWFSTGYWVNAPGIPEAIPNNGSDFFGLVNWGDTVQAPDLDPRFYGPIAISFFANASPLTDYLGLGTIDVVGGISEDSDYCYNYGVNCSMHGNLMIETTLTYTYAANAAVPEPATIAFLAGGFLALAFVLRRPLKRPVRIRRR